MDDYAKAVGDSLRGKDLTKFKKCPACSQILYLIVGLAKRYECRNTMCRKEYSTKEIDGT